MKNIYKNLILLSVLLFAVSCDKDPDNPVYGIIDSPENGAVLRTVSIQNVLLNSSNPDSEVSITVEAQDKEDGGLMESVNVYASIRDFTPDNGDTPASKSLVKTISPSEFSEGPVGLPRTTITMTFAEATSAMGLSSDDYAPGDIYVMDLELNLTDGRSFDSSSSTAALTGVFFSSSFAYNAPLICSPKPGDYTVVMQDSYGDGWQTNTGNGGDGIAVDMDGTIVQIGMCSQYDDGSWLGTSGGLDGGVTGCTPNDGYDGTGVVTIPVGTEIATWSFPGDQYGEISYQIYAPDGSLLFDSGGFGESPVGLLPFANCL